MENKYNGKHPPLYFSSSYGSRVPKSEYQMEINSRKADIITIGDSFTHGDEVQKILGHIC